MERRIDGTTEAGKKGTEGEKQGGERGETKENGRAILSEPPSEIIRVSNGMEEADWATGPADEPVCNLHPLARNTSALQTEIRTFRKRQCRHGEIRDCTRAAPAIGDTEKVLSSLRRKRQGQRKRNLRQGELSMEICLHFTCSSARNGSRQIAQSPQLSSRPRDAAAAASHPSRVSREGGAGTKP